MDWNEYAWVFMLRVLEEFEVADKMALKQRRPFPFKVYGLSYCPACDSITDSETDAFTTVLEYAPIFPSVVEAALRRSSICAGCGGPAIPLGYAISHFCRMLPTEHIKSGELETYLRTFGTVKNHPEAMEGYIIAAVSAFGRKIAKIYLIEEKGGERRFCLVKIEEDPKAWWVLSLQKIDLNNILENKRSIFAGSAPAGVIFDECHKRVSQPHACGENSRSKGFSRVGAAGGREEAGH